MHLNRDGFALADIPCDNDTGGHAVQDSVEAWIEAAATQLVEPLTAVNCLLNPAIVLVGGRLPAAVLDGLTNRLNTRLAEACDGIPALAPVARAALSADAPAVGAAILPFSHFLLPKPGALWKTPGHDQ
jgi:predicted NBD/HSP70 family sugar kinase